MRLFLRLSLVACFLCFIFGVNAALANEEQGEPRTVKTVTTVTVKRLKTDLTLPFNGLFVPREEVAVGTSLSNERIATVDAEIGDHVAKGQVLVRLNTAKLDHNLRENEGRVARARAAVAQQQASFRQAEANFARAQRLIGSRTISKQDFDERQSALDVARQGVTVAEAEFIQAEAQLAEAKSERAKAVVEAPVAGIISERKARAGALAGTEPLLMLIRNGEIELAADIPESELSLLKAGQVARVTLPGGQLVSGHIRLVSPKIDPQTRLGTAYIAFENTSSLFAGVFGRAEVLLGQSDSIFVNNSAVLYSEGAKDTFVFVVTDGKAVKRNVTLGVRRNGQVEVLTGLQNGDQLIEKAGPLLYDGEAVVSLPISAAMAVHKIISP